MPYFKQNMPVNIILISFQTSLFDLFSATRAKICFTRPNSHYGRRKNHTKIYCEHFDALTYIVQCTMLRAVLSWENFITKLSYNQFFNKAFKVISYLI